MQLVLALKVSKTLVRSQRPRRRGTHKGGGMNMIQFAAAHMSKTQAKLTDLNAQAAKRRQKDAQGAARRHREAKAEAVRRLQESELVPTRSPAAAAAANTIHTHLAAAETSPLAFPSTKQKNCQHSPTARNQHKMQDEDKDEKKFQTKLWKKLEKTVVVPFTAREAELPTPSLHRLAETTETDSDREHLLGLLRLRPSWSGFVFVERLVVGHDEGNCKAIKQWQQNFDAKYFRSVEDQPLCESRHCSEEGILKMIIKSGHLLHLVKHRVLPNSKRGIREKLEEWCAVLRTKSGRRFPVYSGECQFGTAAAPYLQQGEQSEPEIGTFAAANIGAGDVIGEFVGDVIPVAVEESDDDQTATQDMSTQQAEDCTESVKKESFVYHVRLDGLNLDIDAREKGSETSFINTYGASSEGNNAMFVEVALNGEVHVLVIALKAIQEKEQIYVDYGELFIESRKKVQRLDQHREQCEKAGRLALHANEEGTRFDERAANGLPEPAANEQNQDGLGDAMRVEGMDSVDRGQSKQQASMDKSRGLELQGGDAGMTDSVLAGASSGIDFAAVAAQQTLPNGKRPRDEPESDATQQQLPQKAARTAEMSASPAGGMKSASTPSPRPSGGGGGNSSPSQSNQAWSEAVKGGEPVYCCGTGVHAGKRLDGIMVKDSDCATLKLRIVPKSGGPPLSLSSFATAANNKLHRPSAATIIERSGLALQDALEQTKEVFETRPRVKVAKQADAVAAASESATVGVEKEGEGEKEDVEAVAASATAASADSLGRKSGGGTEGAAPLVQTAETRVVCDELSTDQDDRDQPERLGECQLKLHRKLLSLAEEGIVQLTFGEHDMRGGEDAGDCRISEIRAEGPAWHAAIKRLNQSIDSSGASEGSQGPSEKLQQCLRECGVVLQKVGCSARKSAMPTEQTCEELSAGATDSEQPAQNRASTPPAPAPARGSGIADEPEETAQPQSTSREAVLPPSSSAAASGKRGRPKKAAAAPVQPTPTSKTPEVVENAAWFNTAYAESPHLTAQLDNVLTLLVASKSQAPPQRPVQQQQRTVPIGNAHTTPGGMTQEQVQNMRMQLANAMQEKYGTGVSARFNQELDKRPPNSWFDICLASNATFPNNPEIYQHFLNPATQALALALAQARVPGDVAGGSGGGGDGGHLRTHLDLPARCKRAQESVFGKEQNLALMEGVAGLEVTLLGSVQQGSLKSRLDVIDEHLGFGPK